MSRLQLGFGALAAVLVAFLALPVAALFLTTSAGEVLQGLRAPLVLPALWLSLGTTAASLSLVIALGTPLSWLLSRSQGRLARAVETAVQLPVVIPPAVAGLALLLAFGRRGLLGGLSLQLAFTTAAVVLAEVFVAAPFYIQAATAAFRRVDEELLIVARTLGAGPLRTFFRVAPRWRGRARWASSAPR
jgi:molybdate transport system permease protein